MSSIYAETRTGPRVTVYLVNHNYEAYVREAIESVLAQTLSDYELLIIDDGSTDGSRAVIEEYLDPPGVRAIFQANKGLNATNNVALREARGKYLMRLDADDYLDPNALSVLAGMLDQDPQVGLVFPDYYKVASDGAVMGIVRRHDFDQVEMMDQPAHGACTMFRRECLLTLGGYDDSFRCQDGWDIWVRFIAHYGVRNVSLPLFYYRQHPKSLTRNEERLLATRAEIIRKRVVTVDTPLDCYAVIPVVSSRGSTAEVALDELADKPLIDWTIEAALEARNISRVFVSSDKRAVLSHVKARFGDAVRTVQYADRTYDQEEMLDIALYSAFDSLPSDERTFSAVMVLFVESPFRSARYIDMAVDTMNLFDADRVIGVRPEMDLMFRHDGSGMIPIRSARKVQLESHELYRQVGDFELLRRTVFYRDIPDRRRERIGHILLGRAAAHRVADEWDWSIAEHLAHKRAADRNAVA